MRRVLLALALGYVLVAGLNRVAERFGLMTCGCAPDCWCHRRGLSLFRWVFPWRHTSAHSAHDKAELDLG